MLARRGWLTDEARRDISGGVRSVSSINEIVLSVLHPSGRLVYSVPRYTTIASFLFLCLSSTLSKQGTALSTVSSLGFGSGDEGLQLPKGFLILSRPGLIGPGGRHERIVQFETLFFTSQIGGPTLSWALAIKLDLCIF